MERNVVNLAFSKIFEKAIKNRLIAFLTINDVINKQQHRLIKGKSTFTALSELIENNLRGLDKKE